jgi:hypothetical protein
MGVPSINGFAGVEAAIRRAASATGVDFDFLLRTAKRESGLNPSAKAPTSSAAGLFQFVDQTWLSTLKRYGAKHGLGGYAAAIQQGSDGRWRVNDPTARRAVMALRLDPQASSMMAGEMTADHAAYLRGRTGRDPSAGELYAAHFLGPAGSAKLIETAQSRPAAPAANLFPAAAEANRSIFFHGGRMLSVTEVLANLARTGGQSGCVTHAQVSAPIDETSVRNAAIAERMDRIKRDEAVLNLFNNKDGGGGLGGGSLVDAQLLGAFGPGDDHKS